VGVSADPVDRQKEFDDVNRLGFPLLSDPDKAWAKAFGVKRVGPLPSKRATFVIGADKRVMAVVRSETNMLGHADDALEVLRAARP
jgi:thioredoxin-dependent peroxiredoxin